MIRFGACAVCILILQGHGPWADKARPSEMLRTNTKRPQVFEIIHPPPDCRLGISRLTQRALFPYSVMCEEIAKPIGIDPIYLEDIYPTDTPMHARPCIVGDGIGGDVKATDVGDEDVISVFISPEVFDNGISDMW
jgi:hypothetical protein